MKILILDLNTDFEPVYRRKLSSLKADIDFLSCPQKKLTKYLNKRDYDLVLMTHYLKGTTGPKVFEEIRSKGYTGIIAILAPGNNIEEIKKQYKEKVFVMNKGLNASDFSTELKKLVYTDSLVSELSQ